MHLPPPSFAYYLLYILKNLEKHLYEKYQNREKFYKKVVF